jgi:hypothetical protein
MTIERRLARAGFTLTRDYPVPLERVWDAFAEEDQRLDWFGASDTFEPGEWAFDFRVGGRDVAEGTSPRGRFTTVRCRCTRRRTPTSSSTSVSSRRTTCGSTRSTCQRRWRRSSSSRSTRAPGSRTSSTASSSTNSGLTDRAARKAAGDCSRLWATASRDAPPAIGRWPPFAGLGSGRRADGAILRCLHSRQQIACDALIRRCEVCIWWLIAREDHDQQPTHRPRLLPGAV